jgi:hypothetical protein
MDIEFCNHGSVMLLFGRSDAGQDWLDENVAPEDEEGQFWGGGIVVEPRFAADIAQGAIDAGLVVA